LELLRELNLSADQLPALATAKGAFPLRVPRYFVGLMRRGDPKDPLLAQVLPLAAEQLAAEGYVSDPVGDMAASQDHGILKKYRGRALMVTTGACAVHCRYCFRRHFPYAEHTLLRHWEDALAALAELPDCHELIFSGGDPLSLSDRRLEQLVHAADAVPQLQRLRVHTRLPVVLPQRVTARLVESFRNSRLQTLIVIHANHPNEITNELGAALNKLTTEGIPILNQSVLLRSVNDRADILTALSEALFSIGVMPYYLHLLDPVAGAAHFDVPLAQARVLQAEMRERLPGYLVPRVVKEIPGADSKTAIADL
jgi:EF-P beta-lysylation protein EpmB